jgi:hypothetical protein
MNLPSECRPKPTTDLTQVVRVLAQPLSEALHLELALAPELEQSRPPSHP